jgi:hypothetical protein
MDDIPDFGDLTGLTRLYWLAVKRIRASDLEDNGNVAFTNRLKQACLTSGHTCYRHSSI